MGKASQGTSERRAGMKAWLTIDGEDSDAPAMIVFAETRGQAKTRAMLEMCCDEFTHIRVRRVPECDSKALTLDITDADYLRVGCWVECRGCSRECTATGNVGAYAVGVPDEAGNVWCDECREGGET